MARARPTRVILYQLSSQLHGEVRKLLMRPAIDADGRLRRQIGAAMESVARSIADALEADRDRDFARHIRLAREAATAVRDGFQSALIKRYVSDADLRAVRLILGQLYPALTSLLLSTTNVQSEGYSRELKAD